MGVDTSDMDAFISEMEKMGADLDSFYKDTAHDIAGRMLALVVPRTIVGVYPNSKRIGGTLRRGWVSDAHKESYDKTQNGAPTPSPQEVQARAKSLKVQKRTGEYLIEVKNPVEYASLIEYGYVMKNGKPYTGRYMMTKSAQQLQAILPSVLGKNFSNWIEMRVGK